MDEKKIFCVIGNSGHGKSYFIKNLLPSIDIIHGSSRNGESVTKEITKFEGETIFGNILIYDTPGLPDPNPSNNKYILNQIINKFLESDIQSIDGIILIQNITIARKFTEYNSIFKSLSSNFHNQNILMNFTYSNSLRDQLNLKNKEVYKKICEEINITNYIFWDSEYPIDGQEELLKICLNNIQRLNIDKYEIFKSLIYNVQLKLQKMNSTIEEYYEDELFPKVIEVEKEREVECFWKSNSYIKAEKKLIEAYIADDIIEIDLKPFGAKRIKEYKIFSFNYIDSDYRESRLELDPDGVSGKFIPRLKIHMGLGYILGNKSDHGSADFEIQIWYIKDEKYFEEIIINELKQVKKFRKVERSLDEFYEEARKIALLNILKSN